MADNTIILQGKFTADGTAKLLQLRSDVDWVRVYNWTQASTQQSTGRGVEFYWQRGMADDSAIVYKKKDSAVDDLKMITVVSGGFSLVNSVSSPALAAANTSITAISTASLPVVSASDTTGLSNGDVVRLIDVAGAQQLGGLDFTIDSLSASTSFRLPYMAQLGGAGTTGTFRRVNYDSLFAPRSRYISNISVASAAVVKMTVTHNMVVGQKVKLVVPAIYGMIEADGLTGMITAINTTTNTITLDIDSSTFTAFAFPATTDVPFSPAMVIPFGEDVTYPNLSDDSVNNTGVMGIKLASGVVSPAGSASDVIYWTAGKSFSVTNE